MKLQTDQLVENARRGDKAAANQLIDSFYERIYAFLRRLSANHADAADLAQRTFSRVWQALPTFAGRSSFNSWLSTSKANTCAASLQLVERTCSVRER